MSKQNPESDFQYQNKHRIKSADEPSGLDPMMASMGYTRTDKPNGIEYKLPKEKDPVQEFLEREADQANPADSICQPLYKLGDIVYYVEVITNKYTPSAEFSIWKCQITWIQWDGGEYNYVLHNIYENERMEGLATEEQLYHAQEDAVNYAIEYVRDYYNDKE